MAGKVTNKRSREQSHQMDMFGLLKKQKPFYFIFIKWSRDLHPNHRHELSSRAQVWSPRRLGQPFDPNLRPIKKQKKRHY
ncbi:uncharacterized protein G2W53_043904 [Senna tora]|uniref:Uncharacterized protein n=1 Tax=Senna tora TaxID=362788 RepID=A0A834SLI4_9FABA|nr:uncharacterized protein G2W53_043904 [Senna tora]